VATTICGRSTTAGIETGPTDTEIFEDVVAGLDPALSVYRRGAGVEPHPLARLIRMKTKVTIVRLCIGLSSDDLKYSTTTTSIKLGTET